MDPQTKLLLAQDLRRDEGVRSRAYQDTKGIWTVGVGHNLLSGPVLSQQAIAQILSDDLDSTFQFLDLHLPWWLNLDPVRQRVLANMAFNLGHGLLEFHQTLGFIQAGNYPAAAHAMLQSQWATQVGARADRLAQIMESGNPL